MALVEFTPNLARHIDCKTVTCSGVTVNDVLKCVFEKKPGMKDYILDNQGRVRKHVVIFIDAILIEDRITLSDPVTNSSKLTVMQALSGG